MNELASTTPEGNPGTKSSRNPLRWLFNIIKWIWGLLTGLIKIIFWSLLTLLIITAYFTRPGENKHDQIIPALLLSKDISLVEKPKFLFGKKYTDYYLFSTMKTKNGEIISIGLFDHVIIVYNPKEKK